MSNNNPAISFSVVIIIVIAILTLLVSMIPPPEKRHDVNSEQARELCTRMGKVMGTEKAVVVGSMCCTEYTCLEIKR